MPRTKRMRPTWSIWSHSSRRRRWDRSACWGTIRRGFMVSLEQQQNDQSGGEALMAKGLVEMIARRTAWLGLAAMLVALAPQAQAAWPEKPIKFVLPFGAG